MSSNNADASTSIRLRSEVYRIDLGSVAAEFPEMIPTRTIAEHLNFYKFVMLSVVRVDPPICDRAVQIILGLLKKLNEMEAQLKRRTGREETMDLLGFVMVGCRNMVCNIKFEVVW
ncbi:hypothetical protein CsSME_00001343 [Camellia sinensis var. sinensis]